MILSQPLSDFQGMNDVSGEMEMIGYIISVWLGLLWLWVEGVGSWCGGVGGGGSQRCQRFNSRFLDPWPEVIKLFSCSSQLSMKFFLLSFS